MQRKSTHSHARRAISCQCELLSFRKLLSRFTWRTIHLVQPSFARRTWPSSVSFIAIFDLQWGHSIFSSFSICLIRLYSMSLVNRGLPQLGHLECQKSNISNTVQIAPINITNIPRTLGNKQIVWKSNSNFNATKTPKQHNTWKHNNKHISFLHLWNLSIFITTLSIISCTDCNRGPRRVCP